VVKQPCRRGEWTVEAVAADLRRSWTAPLSRHFSIIIHDETGLYNCCTNLSHRGT